MHNYTALRRSGTEKGVGIWLYSAIQSNCRHDIESDSAGIRSAGRPPARLKDTELRPTSVPLQKIVIDTARPDVLIWKNSAVLALVSLSLLPCR